MRNNSIDIKKYGLIGLLLKPLSNRLSPPLSKTFISANMVTSVNICLIGLLVYSFAESQSLAAAILILIITFFDYLDGDIARHKKETSQFGQFFDGFADICFWLAIRVGAALFIGNIIFLALACSIQIISTHTIKHLKTLERDEKRDTVSRFVSSVFFLFNSIDIKIYLALFLLFAAEHIHIWIYIDLFFLAAFFAFNFIKVLKLESRSSHSG